MHLSLSICIILTYIDNSIIKPKTLQLDNKTFYIGNERGAVIQMQQEIDNFKLGLKIKEVRQSKGLTQDRLAEMVSCNTSHISNIENNHTKVSLNVLLAIANALNTSIDYLLSNPYENSSLALDNEILRAIKNCNDEKKEKILKMIAIL